MKSSALNKTLTSIANAQKMYFNSNYRAIEMQTYMTAKNHNWANKTIYQIITSPHTQNYLLGTIAIQSQALGNIVTMPHIWPINNQSYPKLTTTTFRSNKSNTA